MNTILNVGIMPREQYQQRLLDIAGGRYKPKANEPKIWFSSIKSLSAVLSDHNVNLLKMIREQHPENLKALSEISGREVSNLSRTLKTMERYGIVELQKQQRMVKPIVKATEFAIQYRL